MNTPVDSLPGERLVSGPEQGLPGEKLVSSVPDSLPGEKLVSSLPGEQRIPVSDQVYLDTKASTLDVGLPPMRKKTWDDAFKNVAESPLSYLPYVNAVDVIQAGRMLGIAHDVQKGLAGPEQKRELSTFLAQQNAKTSFGYDVWNVVLRLPAYAFEFFTAGGIIKGIGEIGVRSGVKAGLTAAGKELTEAAIKAGTEEAMKSAAPNLVAKIFKYMAQPGATEAAEEAVSKLGKTLAAEGATEASKQAGLQLARKELTSAAVRGLAESPIRAALAPGRVAVDTVNYMTPRFNLTTDEQGKVQAVISNEKDDFPKALFKAFVGQSIENFSETVGPQLTFLKAVAGESFPALAKSVLLNRLFTAVRDPADKSRLVNRIIRTGWSGVLPEMYEERIGDVMKFATGLQPNLFPSLKQLATEAVAFAIPGVTTHMATGGLEATFGNPYGERAATATAALTGIEQARLQGIVTAPQIDGLVKTVDQAVKQANEKSITGGEKRGSFTRQMNTIFKDVFDQTFFNLDKLNAAQRDGKLREYLLDYMGIPEHRIVTPEEFQQLQPAIDAKQIGLFTRNTYEPLRDVLSSGRSLMFIGFDEAQKIPELVDKLGLIRLITKPEDWIQNRDKLVVRNEVTPEYITKESGMDPRYHEKALQVLEAVKAEGNKVDIVKPVILALTQDEFANATNMQVEAHDVKSGEKRGGQDVYYKMVAGHWAPGRISLVPGAGLRDLVEEFIHSHDIPGDPLRDFRDQVWYPAVKRAVQLGAADEMTEFMQRRRNDQILKLQKQIETIQVLQADKGKLETAEATQLAHLQQQKDTLEQEGIAARLENQKQRAEQRIAQLEGFKTVEPEPWMNYTKILRALEDSNNDFGQRAEFFAKAVTNHLGFPFHESSIYNQVNLARKGSPMEQAAEQVLKLSFGENIQKMRLGVMRTAAITPEEIPVSTQGLIKPGIWAWWTSNGTVQWSTPRKVTRVERASNGEDYAFVEGSRTGIPVDELTEATAQDLQQTFQQGGMGLSDDDIRLVGGDRFSLLSIASDARKADPDQFRIEGRVERGSSHVLAFRPSDIRVQDGVDPISKQPIIRTIHFTTSDSPQIQHDKDEYGDEWYVAYMGYRELVATQANPPDGETIKQSYLKLLQKVVDGIGTPPPADFVGTEQQERSAKEQRVQTIPFEQRVKNFEKKVTKAGQSEPPLHIARPKPVIQEGGTSLAQTNYFALQEEQLQQRADRGDVKAQQLLARMQRRRSEGTTIPYLPEIEGMTRGNPQLAYQPILERAPRDYDQENTPEYAVDDYLYDRESYRAVVPAWLYENQDALDFALDLLERGYGPDQVVDQLLNETDFIDPKRVENIINGTLQPEDNRVYHGLAQTIRGRRTVRTEENLLKTAEPRDVKILQDDMVYDLANSIRALRQNIERYQFVGGKPQRGEPVRNPLQIASVTKPLNEFFYGERKAMTFDESTNEEIIRERYGEDADAMLENMTPSEVKELARQAESEDTEDVVDDDEATTSENVNTIESHRPFKELDTTRPLAHSLQSVVFAGENVMRSMLLHLNARKEDELGGTIRAGLIENLLRMNPDLKLPRSYFFNPNRETLAPFDLLQQKARAFIKAVDGAIVFYNPVLDEYYGLPLQRLIHMADSGRYPFSHVKGRDVEDPVTGQTVKEWNLDPLRAQMDKPIGNVFRGLGHGYRGILVIPTNLNLTRKETATVIQAWIVQNRIRNLGIIALERPQEASSHLIGNLLPGLQDALTRVPSPMLQEMNVDEMLSPKEPPEFSQFFKEGAGGMESIGVQARIQSAARRVKERVLPLEGPLSKVNAEKTVQLGNLHQIDRNFLVRIEPGAKQGLTESDGVKTLTLDPEAIHRFYESGNVAAVVPAGLRSSEGDVVRFVLARAIVQGMVKQNPNESDEAYEKRLGAYVMAYLNREARDKVNTSLFGERFRKTLTLYQQHTTEAGKTIGKAPGSPVVTKEQGRFSLHSIDDAHYLELAKNPEKNKAELQRMVDEVFAKKAVKDLGSYIEYLHGNPMRSRDPNTTHGKYLDAYFIGLRRMSDGLRKLSGTNPAGEAEDIFRLVDEAESLYAKGDIPRAIELGEKALQTLHIDEYSTLFREDYTSKFFSGIAVPVIYKDGKPVPLSQRFDIQSNDTRFSLHSMLVDASKDGRGRPDYAMASKLIRALTDGKNTKRQQWALGWLGRYDRKNLDLYRSIAGRAQNLARQAEHDRFSLVSIDTMVQDSPWKILSGPSGMHATMLRAIRIRNAATQAAWLRAAGWRQKVPDPHIQEAITHARQGDKASLQVLKDYDTANGNTNAMDVLEDVRKAFDEQIRMLNEEAQHWNEQGWIRYRENYMPQYWASTNGEPVKANLERWALESGRTKKRTIMSIKEGEAFGLVPAVVNAFDLYEKYARDTWQVAAHRLFFYTAMDLKDADGQPMMAAAEKGHVPPKQPTSKYIRYESPFSAYDYIWLHPEAKFAFDQMFQQKWHNRFIDLIEHWNQWTKFLALSLSAFHHFSLTESLVAITGKRWLDDGFKWDSPFNPFRLIKRAATGELLQDVLNRPDIADAALRAGLQIGLNPNIEMGLIDKDLDAAIEWATRNKVSLALPILNSFKGLKDWNNKKLWVQGQSAVKLYLFNALSERLYMDAASRGIAVDKAKMEEDLAKFLNTSFGGIEWAQYRWATPRARQLLHLLVFAPDWTLSNINIAGIPAFFGEKYSKQQVEMMVKDYWPAMLLTITALPAAVQAAIYYAIGDPDQDNPWMFGNEDGKRTYIDVTPIVRQMDKVFGGQWMGPNGKQRWYLRYGKQAWEIADWMSEPYQTLMAKTSMAFKTAFEQATGTNTSGWELPFKNMGFWEGLYTGEREKAVVYKLLPMSIQTLLEGRPSTFFAPISKGMTRGKATQLMQEALLKYADPKAYPALQKIPGYQDRMVEIVQSIADAAHDNGLNAPELVASAKRFILGDYYEQFWRAINAKDLEKAETLAESIVRLGGLVDGVDQSMARKAKTYGMEYTDEMKQEAEKALRMGEAAQGVPFSMSREERKAQKVLKTLGPVAPQAELPIVSPAG